MNGATRMGARAASVLLACIVCMLPWAALGGSGKVEIVAQSTTVSSPNGDYYVIKFDLPQNVSAVRHGWLEAYVDVSRSNEEMPEDAAPMLDVFVLKHALSQQPTESDFEVMRIPLSRPVALGTNRLVRIDISEFAQTILREPARNHGLVIGSLSGTQTARFSIKSDGFGPGVPIRVTIIQ